MFLACILEFPRRLRKFVTQFGRENCIQIIIFVDLKNDTWNLYDIGLMCPYYVYLLKLYAFKVLKHKVEIPYLYV